VKRYTAKFAAPGSSPEELRARVDKYLANNTTAYRLGQDVAAGADAAWVEVATDEPRFRLERQLAGLGDNGLRLEQLGWGWIIGPTAAEAADAAGDPLAQTPPQAEPVREYRTHGFPALLYLLKTIFLVGALMVMVLLSSAGILPTEAVPVILLLLVWIFIAFAHDFTRVRTVRCQPDGLTMERWFRSGVQRFGWDEIVGMDFMLDTGHARVLRQRGRLLDFPLTSPTAPPDGRTLGSTIVARAHLNFVECVPIKRAHYRRFEVP
jgi:hypothetical protein